MSSFQENGSLGLPRACMLANSAVLLGIAGFKLQNRILKTATHGALIIVLLRLANINISIWQIGLYSAILASLYGLWTVLPILHGLFESREALDKSLGRFRPLFFLSCTTHCRFQPTMHKFKYPLLYIGIPLDFTGSIGSLLSVRGVEKDEEDAAPKKFTFFTLDPTTYLEPELPFKTKLQPVLAYHGFDLKDFPHGYMITTPKFFGYSFNPVSYFYLYDKDMKLRLIVLEVNNTFGEKHVYLLDAEGSETMSPRSGYDYAGVMRKSFHISPFNHRSGDYLIQCRDPIRPNTDDEPKLDIHVIVRSREGAKIMVARAFSVQKTFDPIKGSVFQILQLVFKWGWAVFMAVPQTMYEAWKIYRKNSKVYNRPEPLPGSGQRNATKTELQMQEMWLDNLQHKVSIFPRPVRVTVLLPQSAVLREAENCCYYSSSYSKADNNNAEVTIRVKTPRFFSRFFSHQDASQTLFLDTTTQSAEHRAADINDAFLLVEILGCSRKEVDGSIAPRKSLYWRFFAWMRNKKTTAELANVSADSGSEIGELLPPAVFEKGSLSAMDSHFLSNPSTARRYQRIVAKAVLIDTLAFNDPESFELYQNIFKLGAFAISAFVTIVTLTQAHAGSLVDLLASGDFSSILSCPRFFFELGALNAPLIIGAL